jgi:hypothetical protein
MPNRVTADVREAALANLAPRPAPPGSGRKAISLSSPNIRRLLEETRGKAPLAGLDHSDDQRVALTYQALCDVIGVKTIDVALRLLSQLVHLQHTETPQSDADELVKSIALLAELQPTNATEALLSVQMIGVHQAAMVFLARATAEGQTLLGADANVLRATRLLRLFTEQLEALAKLRGKTSQQKVIVEHVTVAAGGQAIVGVVPGGRWCGGDDPR